MLGLFDVSKTNHEAHVVHEVSLTLENLFLGEFLMLKSTGLVHLATIYIDAVSVFKSWNHWKSET